MSYDSIRLETLDGTVVAYFAPNFEVNPQYNNDVTDVPRQGDRPARVVGNGLWTQELVVQGTFMHSDEVNPDFREALQDLFAAQTVTAIDQVNRLCDMVVYSETESFVLHHRGNEYAATSVGSIDAANGIYPAVTPSELRMPEEAEWSHSRTDYMVRMSSGIPRESEPEEPDV